MSNGPECRVFPDKSVKCLLWQINAPIHMKSERINNLTSCLSKASIVVNGWIKTVISNTNKAFEKEFCRIVVRKIMDILPINSVNVSSSIFWKNYTVVRGEIFYELFRMERQRNSTSHYHRKSRNYWDSWIRSRL